MIITVGGQKGGTGKTTVACNLAVYLQSKGEDVLLIDADEQHTATFWATIREENSKTESIPCLSKSGNLKETLADMRHRYGYIIVDVDGRSGKALRSAMCVSDVLLTPLRPSQHDLWTMEHVVGIVDEVRITNPALRCVFALNMAPNNPKIREVGQAQELLKGLDNVELAPSTVHDRKAFRDASYDGLGVIELNDPKAIAEIEALAQDIFGEKYDAKAA
jgi:chromosome partitioning protein